MIPPVARRFVAGETMVEALNRAEAVNHDGLGAIINLLGEHYSDRAVVGEDTRSYLDLIDDIHRLDIDACVSVKPTQLGLDVSEALFEEQLRQIVEEAREAGVFVWIDMEGSETTEPTLQVFESMTEHYPRGVGVCLQANLRRTGRDIERLNDLPGKIRLVKGAYREPEGLAYRSQTRVNQAYRAHLETLFRGREWGIAVASHDPAMIEYATQLHEVHGASFEFQLLMGIAEETQRELRNEHDVYQYIPYGPRWFSYFTRRLLERTENIKFAFHALRNR